MLKVSVDDSEEESTVGCWSEDGDDSTAECSSGDEDYDMFMQDIRFRISRLEHRVPTVAVSM